MDPVARQNLTDFGQYVAECMPKYVQKVQLTAGDELEVLIAPEGVLPVISFLKEHHNAQFASLADIAGLDMPTREYRFEVSFHSYIKDLAPRLGYFYFVLNIYLLNLQTEHNYVLDCIQSSLTPI